MAVDIFKYKNYKQYLLEKIQSMPSRGRGVRLSMAKHLNCQTAYISQVLNQHVHFSLEQAAKVNSFFHHSRDEARFFFLMVQFARAGSKELENFIEEELNEILVKREDLENRHRVENLDELNQHIYYSAWYYAAIHILLSIPEFQTAESISQYLKLPLTQVKDALDFLVETGLAVTEGKKFKIGKTRIHLSKKSIQIRRHHTNWRNRAIDSIDKNEMDDLHYSSVVSLSDKDIEKIKKILVDSIDNCKEVIKDSPEEKLRVFNIDFFKL